MVMVTTPPLWRWWLHLRAEGPWVGAALAEEAVPAHRVALQGGHADGRPHLLAARGAVGDPLAPIAHHLGSPDVKGGSVRGAGWAVAVSPVVVELAGGGSGAALAVRRTRVVGVACAEVRARGKVGLFLFLLLLLFLIGVIFFAAIVLGEKGRGHSQPCHVPPPQKPPAGLSPLGSINPWVQQSSRSRTKPGQGPSVLREAAAGELVLSPASEVCSGEVFHHASWKPLQGTAGLFVTRALLCGADFTLTFKEQEVVASHG